MRNKEMGSYKASRVSYLPWTTLRCYVKERQKSSSETIKTKLGRKQFLPCEVENDLAQHCRLMERKIFFFTVADVMHLAYLLVIRNRIKPKFSREMKRLEGSGWKISNVVIKKFQLQPLKFCTLKSEGFHSWISNSLFLNLRTCNAHHSA
jgi:hypothetical protein